MAASADSAQAAGTPAVEEQSNESRFPHSASLYVGDLSKDVIEAELYNFFNSFGATVQSVRVCRDMVTQTSLGYGYVNFATPEDAAKVYEAANFEELKGQPVRIMFSERDPTKRRSGVGNIFIKNLSAEVDNKALYDTFRVFGTVLSCRVLYDQEGNSRGIAFVQYEDAEVAKQVIAQVNDKKILDKVVKVEAYKPRRQRMLEAEETQKNFTNVFFKNVAADISDEDIMKEFENFGEIESKVLKSHDQFGRYGFVAYKDTADAQKAVSELNDKPLGADGTKLYVARAQRKSERMGRLRREFERRRTEMRAKYKDANLYIKNFSEDVTEDELRKMFEAYGTIVSVRVVKDRDGQSRQFGFVLFSSEEEATRAIQEMNGRMTADGKPLYVSRFRNKEERAQEVQRQRMMTAQNMQYQQWMTQQGGGMPPMGFNPMQQMSMQAQMAGRSGPQHGMPPMQTPMMATPNNAQQPSAAAAAPAELSAAKDKNSRNAVLGNPLFSLVQAQQPKHAPKITGMLLDQPDEAVLEYLENPAALKAALDQAYKVLVEQAPAAGKQ
ncbi:uncharacterized protein MONBRDRAFT_33438 [Monosiga brevicollis MX1]|uniref:Polyadenylate-binding protein n=1 Tax=Monosiga brevicollis TaxID=81824 RepID=A9V5E5_MONBE|nr:uncharacterized protein MONBRDRAFT_33438 [Monosiga brevicollis MX1]EDQ87268.1 predicted protein [Monosiga brevicollis MX1]|eukprot:XP_001747881.1 hypothetical protein [Monosiga brevicollis MX1]